MERHLTDARDKFTRAMELLAGRAVGPLEAWLGSDNDRLTGAVLQVYPACVRHHFPSLRDYVAFSNLMFDLRLRHPDGEVLKAIALLDPDACARFAKRFAAIALAVTTRPSKSELEPDHRAAKPVYHSRNYHFRFSRFARFPRFSRSSPPPAGS